MAEMASAAPVKIERKMTVQRSGHVTLYVSTDYNGDHARSWKKFSKLLDKSLSRFTKKSEEICLECLEKFWGKILEMKDENWSIGDQNRE